MKKYTNKQWDTFRMFSKDLATPIENEHGICLTTASDYFLGNLIMRLLYLMI